MSAQRLVFIDSVRGLAMLGVIGIHTGSYTLLNPLVNVHLFALLEIASRFSVPIFFFLSAFGLFLNHSLSESFSYGSFLRRRLRSVLVPYVAWSFIYLLHAAYLNHDLSLFSPLDLLKTLFFGLASYQLYFMVLLLWFYCLIPLWRKILGLVVAKPKLILSSLLLLQVIFNYYSSYQLSPHFEWYWVNQWIQYRLNFWVLHYVFIFILGAYLGLTWQTQKDWLQKHFSGLTLFFLTTLGLMLGHYYTLLWSWHWTPEQAVNTVHQLSPFGVLYTLSASLFFIALFASSALPKSVSKFFSVIGRHSNMLYLVHPLVMYYAIEFLLNQLYTLTAAATLFFYALVLSGSFCFSWTLSRISPIIPWLQLVLTGSGMKKTTSSS